MNPIQAFGQMLSGQGSICAQIGKALCYRLNIPYSEDREGEILLGHRLKETSLEEALEKGLLPTRRFKASDGRILDQDDFPTPINDYEQLTEEVWTRANWPDSFNDVSEAIQKCGDGITGAYFHRPSLNLVLLDKVGKKVGIRSTSLMIPMIGLKEENVKLLGRLRRVETK